MFSKKYFKFILCTFAIFSLCSCGGSGGSDASSNQGGGLGGAPTYTIGGIVSGLGIGEQITLTLNGDTANPTSVSSNASFRFTQSVVGNSTYAVAISSAPAGKTCSVVNGTGAGVAANINNVSIACSTTGYQISGTVSGLGSTAVVLVLNGDTNNATTISSNGSFAFTQSVAYNGSYAVTIGTQPTGQTCSVTNSSGAGVVGDIGNVNVSCSTNTFSIGGAVSGLAATQQTTLLLNGDVANPAILTANGSFTFSQQIQYSSSYTVTVGTQPTWQTCSVSTGSGTGVTTNISNVNVYCSTNSYTVSGTVTGLGTQTTLLLNGDTQNPVIKTSNGTFSFPQPVAGGSIYTVTVGTQPTDLKYCQVTNATGAATATVNNVSVSCATGTWVPTVLADINSSFPADPIFDPTNAANSVVRTFAAGSPRDGYMDIYGNYYFLTNSTSPFAVFKIANNGTLTSIGLSNSQINTPSITGDNQGNIYIIDGISIYKLTNNGNVTLLCQNLNTDPNFYFPNSFVYDDTQGLFYLIDSNFLGRIVTLNATSSGCISNVLNNNLTSITRSIKLDNSNNLLVASTTSFSRVNKTTGAISTLITASDVSGWGFVFDPSGNMYFTTRSSSAKAFDSNGNLITLASTLPLDQRGIARNANGDIYLTLYNSKKIVKLSRP